MYRITKPEFYRPSNKNRAAGLEFNAPPTENNNSNPNPHPSIQLIIDVQNKQYKTGMIENKY